MTYIFAKRIIENGTYGDKEEFIQKLDIFLMGNRVTQAEYEELVELVNGKI